MKKTLDKFWYFLFRNYMWLYIIMGICTSFFSIYPMTFQLLMVVSFLYLLFIMRKFKMTNMLDMFVVLFLCWILIVSLTVDYSNHWRMLLQALVSSILPMSFYFLAKCVVYDTETILKKATLPMIIAMVCGLIFYYTEPSWYTAIKMRQIYEISADGSVSDGLMMEMFRLSSFWSTPYVIGYASMYFVDYNLYKLFSNNTIGNKKIYFVLVILSTATILLTQFRASIYSLVLTIGYLMFFAKNRVKFSYIFIILIAGVLIVSFLFDESTDSGMFFRERMINGVDSGHLESRLASTSGGVDLTTAVGNGYGRYGSMARTINNEWPIVDSEYQKILAELGVVGIIPFVGIIISGLLMSFRKKHLQLEFIILMFFALAFVGSSCISAATTFPFFFWYVLGRISLKNKKSYKRQLIR